MINLTGKVREEGPFRNIRLSQNYKMGEGLFFPINNKVVEVKKIDHEKTNMNY